MAFPDAMIPRGPFPPRRFVVVLTLASLGIVALWGGRLALNRIQRAHERAELKSMLTSANKDTRRAAALLAPVQNDDDLLSRLRLMIMGDEPDADVRAAAVEAIGLTRSARFFEVAEFAVDLDESGPVRAAGWLATARLDPERFSALLRQHADRTDAWDQVGRAQARLFLGDVSELDWLFAHAQAADAELRRCACQALQRWLRPVLDAAGRWPLTAAPPNGEAWPPALIAELRKRCGEINLAQEAMETREVLARSTFAHRMERRLANRRERMAKLLFHSYEIESVNMD